MNFPRRLVLGLVAASAVLPIAPPARAQVWPSRPVKIIVGALPGGAVDVTARLMAPFFAEKLGQPFIVENRAGAGFTIATEAVV